MANSQPVTPDTISSKHDDGHDENSTHNDAANIQKITDLLKTSSSSSKSKHDTHVFAGLALVKVVLDESPHMKKDPQLLYQFWHSISPKFISRMIKTGSGSDNKNAQDVLDLAISVLHTFSVLLPPEATKDPRFLDRLPGLIGAILHSSKHSTPPLLELLLTLASNLEGARRIIEVEDLSSLIEIAPSYPMALDIIQYTFLNSSEAIEDKEWLKTRIDDTIQGLISSFKGTDGVTFLSFLANFLSRANRRVISQSPGWVQPAVGFIQKLVMSRPTPEAREAYTNAASILFQIFFDQTSKMLFIDDKSGEKPFAYIFVNLILIDIRSSIPMLLEKLSDQSYPKMSQRLTSGFDIISAFIQFLIHSLEEGQSIPMTPDSILKLRKAISETMSVIIEFLRDRWDASHSGAMGLHPDAISATVETSTGVHKTLAWDSITHSVEEDPLTLAAIRTLSIWLREDDNDQLKREAIGLMDMFLELWSCQQDAGSDFKSPIGIVLEAITRLEEGREQFLKHNGWKILNRDIIAILEKTPFEKNGFGSENYLHGSDLIHALHSIFLQDWDMETPEECMNLLTATAAWNLPERPLLGEDMHTLVLGIDVTHFCCCLLTRANPPLRKRYLHSTVAILGIASRLQSAFPAGDTMRTLIDEVITSMRSCIDGL